MEILERARFFKLPDTNLRIKSLADRQRYKQTWEHKFRDLSAYKATDVSAEELDLEIEVARECAHRLSSVLFHIQDQLKTYDIGEFIPHALDGLKSQQ